MSKIEKPPLDGVAGHRADATSASMSPLLAAGVVFGLAVAMRLGHLGSPPHFDELYHILAARGWLETGEFRILDGYYTRAPLFTWIVAQGFALFGESLEAARITPVLCGGLYMAVIFVWVDAMAGRTAAWIAALLGIAWPDGILISQFTRFYALHGLLFLLGAISVYRLTKAPISRTTAALTAAGAAACLGIAWQLQVITLIGLAGVGIWFGLFIALPFIWSRPERWWLLAGLAATALVAAGLALEQGILGPLWSTFRWAPAWAASTKYYESFYHDQLLTLYPAFWALFPAVILVAVAARPRPALFCATIFCVCLALHSAAGMKDMRYIHYIMPFFFVLLGIAIASVAQPLMGAMAGVVRGAASKVFPSLDAPHLARIGVALVIVFLIVATPAFTRAAVLAIGSGTTLGSEADWRSARPALEPWIDNDTMIVTSDELSALYFLGRTDLLVSETRLSELAGGAEFSDDPRTGIPVVSKLTSVERVLACAHKGLIVARVWEWLQQHYMLRDLVERLDGDRITHVELPSKSRLIAFA